MEIARLDKREITHIAISNYTLIALMRETADYIDGNVNVTDIFELLFGQDSDSGKWYAHLYIYDAAPQDVKP